MRVQENKIESGMEGLKIEEQPSAENRCMNRGPWSRKFPREGACPEQKAQWREMRRQRMAMIRQAMKESETGYGGFPPCGMMPPMMFGPPPHRIGPHHHHHMHQHGRRHFQPRFNPMMYVGPQSNQFEGDLDPLMVRRPMFHPGMMAMMITMFAGFDKGFHGKRKCKLGESEANGTTAGDSGATHEYDGHPPFMMNPWIFKGRGGFNKCMNPDGCKKKAKQDLPDDSEDKTPNENEASGMESDDGKAKQFQDQRKQQIRFMKRFMAMNGSGYPPMMAMYPGAVCPPGVMRRFMQKDKCQHKNKDKKAESEESSASSSVEVVNDGDEIQNHDISKEKSDLAERLETENSDEPDESESKRDRDQKMHGWHKRQMRAIMMNGGFHPMWFMMSQGGFPHQHVCHKGKKNPKQDKSGDKENKDFTEEVEMC